MRGPPENSICSILKKTGSEKVLPVRRWQNLQWQIATDRRRGAEVKDDLRFNLGFGKPADAARFMLGRDMDNGGVIDVGPYGLAHAVLRPHFGIGKTDLSPNGKGALAKSRIVDQMRHRVGARYVKAGQSLRERLDLANLVLRGLHLLCDDVRVKRMRHICRSYLPDAGNNLPANRFAGTQRQTHAGTLRIVFRVMPRRKFALCA